MCNTHQYLLPLNAKNTPFLQKYLPHIPADTPCPCCYTRCSLSAITYRRNLGHSRQHRSAGTPSARAPSSLSTRVPSTQATECTHSVWRPAGVLNARTHARWAPRGIVALHCRPPAIRTPECRGLGSRVPSSCVPTRMRPQATGTVEPSVELNTRSAPEHRRGGHLHADEVSGEPQVY